MKEEKKMGMLYRIKRKRTTKEDKEANKVIVFMSFPFLC
jgi:hypothetical protein